MTDLNSEDGHVTAVASLAQPPSSPIKDVVFLGTPEVAAVTLQALIESSVNVVHVVTKPDKRRGRGSKLSRSPVGELAAEHGIPVSYEPGDALSLEVELGVVVAFGQLIRRPVLEQLAMVNLHFSLLPRWRGAAPVERAILTGDESTGVCVMQIAEGLDVGDIHASTELEIDPEETANDLRGRLAVEGSRLLIDQLMTGLSEPTPQVGDPTYASKLDRSEFRLDFTASADEIHRKIRIGRAWCEFRDRRLIVTSAKQLTLSSMVQSLESGNEELPSEEVPDLKPGKLNGSYVGTGQGVIELVSVKPEGKREMSVGDWLNGTKPTEGDRLS